MLTIRDPARVEGRAIGVSYDAFIDDVQARSSVLNTAAACTAVVLLWRKPNSCLHESREKCRHWAILPPVCDRGAWRAVGGKLGT